MARRRGGGEGRHAAGRRGAAGGEAQRAGRRRRLTRSRREKEEGRGNFVHMGIIESVRPISKPIEAKQMQSLARLAAGLRRPSVGSIFAAVHPPLARRDDPKGNLNCLYWYACRPMLDFGAKGEKRYNPRSETKEQWNTVEGMGRAVVEGTTQKHPMITTEEVIESNLSTPMSARGMMLFPSVFRNSSHRDGAIYKVEEIQWKHDYFDIITNRNETGHNVAGGMSQTMARLEPMRFSVARRCKPDPENCRYHSPCTMVQIFPLKLARAHVNTGPVLLYGYLAARDDLDSALNYVFYRTRDDPIIVQQGSPIEITGPKRGILLYSDVLFEFDMRIKIGEQEEDDLQLIDGIIELYEVEMVDEPTTVRIDGNSGTVYMPVAKISKGVEATVEVVISEVQNGFDFSLSSVVSVGYLPEEFQLFGGYIGESCGLRRFVVAVSLDTLMHLKFKVDQKGSNVAKHCCSFEAKLHGCDTHRIKLEVASISVKVAWSPMRDE
ncbi:hypothetical protein ACP70R_024406 [Stipagrostis hirtigluma subsp. patula]